LSFSKEPKTLQDVDSTAPGQHKDKHMTLPFTTYGYINGKRAIQICSNAIANDDENDQICNATHVIKVVTQGITTPARLSAHQRFKPKPKPSSESGQLLLVTTWF
jgi:hypothetical protein